jgi:hypothetical protein
MAEEESPDKVTGPRRSQKVTEGTSTRSCVETWPCLAAQSTGSFLAGVQTTTVHG